MKAKSSEILQHSVSPMRRAPLEFADIEELSEDASDLVRLIEREGRIGQEFLAFDAE